MIECRKCHCTKSEENFTKKKDRPGNFYKKCKECVRIDSVLYRKAVNADPEKKKRMQEGRKMRKQRYHQTLKGKYTALRAKAKVRNLDVQISFKEYEELTKMGQCHYCSSALPTVGFGIDRKDNNLGYTKENVVACCNLCNTKKGNRLTYEEFCLISKITSSKGQ